MARPSKFNGEFVERYLKAISSGVPPETAARHAGSSPASLYRYLRGAAPRNVEFKEAHDRALAGLEIRLAATISKAALSDPKWALVLLQQRFPERWARTRPANAGEESVHRTTERVLILDPRYAAEAVPLLLEAGRALRGLEPADTQVDPAAFEDDGMPGEGNGAMRGFDAEVDR